MANNNSNIELIEDKQSSSSNGFLNIKETVVKTFIPFKRGKRDRVVLSEDSELESSQILDNFVEDSNKKHKRDHCSETIAECISSPNSNYFNKLKSKKHKRIYRPRVMESSSEDEANESNNVLNCDIKNKAKSDLVTPETESEITEINIKSDNCVLSEIESDPLNSQSLLATDNNCMHENNNCDIKSSTADLSTTDLSTTLDTNRANSTIEEAQNEELGGLDSAPLLSGSAVPVQNEENLAEVSQPAAPSRERASQASSGQRRRRFFRGFLDTDSDDTLDEDVEEEAEASRRERTEERANQRAKLEEEVSKSVKEIMEKPKPKQKWNCLYKLLDREYSNSGRKQSPLLFKNNYGDSLHVIQKLDNKNKLDYHQGCVNALSFNDSGDLLASGSDDLQIAVWDWTKAKTCITYNSGHRNNVFQCKFLPLSGSTHVVSCARDGQVRLAELSAAGVCKDTRRLAKHNNSAHKLATRVNTPYEILSAGEDAVVFNIDIRLDQPDKIVLVKDVHGNKVPLYSIHSHPLNDDQFCVSGQDEYVRVYDRRIISPFGPPVIKYCPNHLVDCKPKSNITCAVYSNNGDAILASYNNEDIYLFDTNLSEGAEYIYRYSGHRNSSTVKGVSFFSPSSKYIVSGSDCGNIFMWDRYTQAIVNFMPGDVNGVVNVLEPHPHLPILATSGLDNDIKVWAPECDKEPQFGDLKKTVRDNMRHRLLETNDDQGLETHMLLLLFQHLRRNPMQSRRRANARGLVDVADNDDDDYGRLDSSDTSSDDSEDSDTNRDDRVQCTTQ